MRKARGAVTLMALVALILRAWRVLSGSAARERRSARRAYHAALMRRALRPRSGWQDWRKGLPTTSDSTDDLTDPARREP